MTIWQDALDGIYGSDIASDVSLLPGAGGTAVTVRGIDKTAGVELANDQGVVETIRPMIFVRFSELTDNGLTAADVDGGTVTLNSREWRIKSHAARPCPDGEAKGEMALILSDEN